MSRNLRTALAGWLAPVAPVRPDPLFEELKELAIRKAAGTLNLGDEARVFQIGEALSRGMTPFPKGDR